MIRSAFRTLLLLALWISLPCGSVLAAGLSHSSAPKRNILLMIGDDHGRHAGCYGDPIAKTPNLDRLASEGVRFSHAFSAVSSCSPSRSVILTGLYNHASGQYGLAHAEHNQSTKPGVKSLPLLLNAAGYRTAILGKNHVQPRDIYPFGQEITAGLVGNRGVSEIADAARTFFSADDRPFFLVVGFADPHRAAKGFGNDRSYRGATPVPTRPEDVSLPAFISDQPEARRDLAEYYQSVNRLDQGIGLTLQALSDSGKADDTLVIYLSDNGMPFVGAKTTLYDSGIRLPLIIHSPSSMRHGVVNDAMVSWVDIAPTILSWAGLTPPPLMTGRSILPILDQEHPPGPAHTKVLIP